MKILDFMGSMVCGSAFALCLSGCSAIEYESPRLSSPSPDTQFAAGDSSKRLPDDLIEVSSLSATAEFKSEYRAKEKKKLGTLHFNRDAKTGESDFSLDLSRMDGAYRASAPLVGTAQRGTMFSLAAGGKSRLFAGLEFRWEF